ncbi:MAG TPA: serine hydroxymethyltransferase, partial [Phycisphaerales bacterium]|nr:serine hydroxymethyltransferase [Phycisphaerales bacterium]
PDDPRPPMITSGLRLGTPATTTRGFKEPEMTQIADWINRTIESKGDEGVMSTVREEVRTLCARFPLQH